VGTAAILLGLAVFIAYRSPAVKRLDEWLLVLDIRIVRWCRASLRTRRERLEMRRENVRRGVSSHHYHRRTTPMRFTWESIRLSAMAECSGSDRWANGLTSE
jgi:hypothetical protein